jgi:tetratricopeptide (TPR) repeat protein
LTEGEVASALDLFKSASSEEELGSIFNNSAVFAVRSLDFTRAHRLYEAALGAITMSELKSRVSFNKGLAFCKEKKLPQAFRCFQMSYKWDPRFEKNLRALHAIQQRLDGEDNVQVGTKVPQNFDYLEEPLGVNSNLNMNEDSGMIEQKTNLHGGSAECESDTFDSGRIIQIDEETGDRTEVSPIGSNPKSKVG